MARELSPLERSRQILQEIDMSERAKRQSANMPRQQAKPVDEVPTGEGVSLEGPPAQAGSSPIYSREIGSESRVLKVDSQSILQGVIFSEILGKPRSMRRR